MGQVAVGVEKGERRGKPAKRRWTPVTALHFVGCESCRMTLEEYESYPEDGRKVEFFDAAAGLAWMARDSAGMHHEAPGQRLAALVSLVALTRGSPIQCLGGAALRLLSPESLQVRSMHPDQLVFLDPLRLQRHEPGFLRVGEDAYPDVVLEVDHTTDVRRSKLTLYEEWGFPEFWLEVPQAYSASRPRGLKPGLRIHLLDEGRYVLSDESRAFPGWRAAEIHRALNEDVISAETSTALTQVGRTLGEREGTGPDDDPLLGAQRAEARAQGFANGRLKGRMGLVRGILASRGIEPSANFPEARDRTSVVAASDAAILSAALSATSDADFLVRLRSTIG